MQTCSVENVRGYHVDLVSYYRGMIYAKRDLPCVCASVATNDHQSWN